MGDYSTYMATLAAQQSDRYKAALRAIVNHLGPEPASCFDNNCDGCRAEMWESLRIAKEALGDDLGKFPTLEENKEV